MFRRNGKPTSCEPCRLSKIRCDHARPTCERCQTRGMVDRCFYHPAPLTRRYDNARRQRTDTPTGQIGESGFEAPRDSSHGDGGQTEYLGSTSFVSALPESIPGVLDSSSFLQDGTDSITLSYAKPQITKIFCFFGQLQEFITRYYNKSQFLIIPRPLVLNPISTISDYLKEAESQGLSPSEVLWTRLIANLKNPLPVVVETTTADEFCGWFTSSSLRWEFVGVISALAGLASSYPEMQDVLDPEALTGTDMFAVSNICLEICEQHNRVNDLTIWLRYTNFALASSLFGDTSTIVYRKFSEFFSELIAMGFHRQKSMQSRTPFFLFETRKRIFTTAFNRDKSLATFLGRPPRIDSYFCDLVLPLDIDDQDVVLSGVGLDALFQKVDEDGWAILPEQKMSLRPATVIRLRYQSSLLREKVLRLSLGNWTKQRMQDLINTYHDFQQRSSDTIPKAYRYDSNCWKRLDANSCMALLIIHLDYLYSGFQIQRILHREGQCALSALLDTSIKLLSPIIDFTRQHERTLELRERFTWIFLFYGLPGAGVLASELHRCRLASRPFTSSIPASKVIRTLVILISWFENTTFPDRSDYRICLKINKVISRLLDESLDLPAATVSRQPSQPEAVGTGVERDAEGETNGYNNQFQQVYFPERTNFSSYNENSDPNVSQPSEWISSENFLSWIDNIGWDDQSIIDFPP